MSALPDQCTADDDRRQDYTCPYQKERIVPASRGHGGARVDPHQAQERHLRLLLQTLTRHPARGIRP